MEPVSRQPIKNLAFDVKRKTPPLMKQTRKDGAAAPVLAAWCDP
jgi:hypothetical protein